MTRWRSTLYGNPNALRWLSEMLQSAPIQVVRGEGDEGDEAYFLIAEQLERLDDARAAYAGATAITEQLRGVVSIYRPTLEQGLRIRNFYRLDGERPTSFSFSEGGIILLSHPAVSPARVAELATQDSKVASVLRYLGQEPTWPWLYNVFEIIRDDVGGKIPDHWDPDGRARLIKSTANNEELVGFGGRKGKQAKRSLPRRYLDNLSEGVDAARSLAGHWLVWVHHGRPLPPG